ncbi:MAG TPA: hypothetical protein VGM90_37700 [Kofleriaceae bacterium]|jgi:hypothetical protein
MRRLAMLAVLFASPACRVSLEKDYQPPPDAMISANCQAAKDELHPTAAFLEQKVFAVGCTASSCHDSDMPEDDQDLTAGHGWMSTVNFVSKEQTNPQYIVVVPFKPKQSYLMMRIHQIPGAEMDPPLPDPVSQSDQDDFYMPQKSSDLCVEKREAIQRWIEDGAPQ